MTPATVSATLQQGIPRRRPDPAAVLELFKPHTWFPPMWAFSCGVVSAGKPLGPALLLLFAGIGLTGPLVCGTSQAVNDWFDRHVDGINQPERPIPSGRIPGAWGLIIAIIGTLLSLGLGLLLGKVALAATALGLVLAWAYSAPPARLKQNGWWGNLAVGLSYEGLAWVTGAALLLGGAVPPTATLLVALLYSLGCHGIMTLNDFKSIDGDTRMGIGSLPVRLGPERSARVACIMMLVPQVIVAGLLASWLHPLAALFVSAVILIQLPLMRRLLEHPRDMSEWYNRTGVPVYVSGMMAAAIALRGGVA